MRPTELIRLLVLGACWLAAAGTARAQTATFDFQGVVLGPLADAPAYFPEEAAMSDVQRVGGQYIMYYNTRAAGNRSVIAYATSPDLLTWTVGQAIFTGSANPADRDFILGGPRVVKLPSGRYRMYYRCGPQFTPPQEPAYHIRSAISDDGLTFVSEGIRIEIKEHDASSFFNHVGHSAFYVNDEGNVAALLTGKDTSDQRPGPDRIYQAVSQDGGLTFTDFVRRYEGCHDPVVVKDSTGTYRAFFTYLNVGFRTASSSDGADWPPTADTLLMRQDEVALDELNFPKLADIGACVDASGAVTLFSNYAARPGPWSVARFQRSGATGMEPRPAQISSALTWPNPARDVLHLEGLPANGRFTLTDPLGRVVRQQAAMSNLDVRDLPAGLWFLRVDGCASPQVLRFVKE